MFTVKGGGADVWGSADAFRYVYQPLHGDGTIVARVAQAQGTQAWVKTGVMIRESLSADSAQGFMIVSVAKGLAFQRRLATGGLSVSTSGGAGLAPVWVKLQRQGNVITASRSDDGVTWTVVGSDTFSMAADVFVGLPVSSHDTTQLATAVFDHVILQ